MSIEIQYFILLELKIALLYVVLVTQRSKMVDLYAYLLRWQRFSLNHNTVVSTLYYLAEEECFPGLVS